jgi:hypothetical protein
MKSDTTLAARTRVAFRSVLLVRTLAAQTNCAHKSRYPELVGLQSALGHAGASDLLRRCDFRTRENSPVDS